MPKVAARALGFRAAVPDLELRAAQGTVPPRRELTHVRQDTGVSEQPGPTPEEQEQTPERLPDEDAMRYPGHDDPHSVEDPDPSSPDS